MSGEAVIVIDVQGCFLPGGALACVNAARNTEFGSYKALPVSIGKFINKINPEHLFLTKDFHPEGHTSFLTEAEKAQGMMTFPEAAGKGEYAKGMNVGRYQGREHGSPRSWGKEEDRYTQKLWPPHCVQGSPDADIAPELLETLTEENREKAVTILKGDDPTIDSYSVVADALGNPTAHDEQGKIFLSILNESQIKKVYIAGIARDVCVYWSALDLLNYWIIPEFKKGNVIKLVFMYDLTRPVFAGNFPYTDINPEAIVDDVKALVQKMGLGPEVVDQVFEMRMGGYAAVGGRRKSRRNGRKGGRKSRSRRGRGRVCRKNHTHSRSCW